MYLPELLCVVGILALSFLDLYMGIRVYERYVSLPRLKELRDKELEIQYLRAKLAEKARRKQVNDLIRRGQAKRFVVIGKRILKEKMAA